MYYLDGPLLLLRFFACELDVQSPERGELDAMDVIYSDHLISSNLGQIAKLCLDILRITSLWTHEGEWSIRSTLDVIDGLLVGARRAGQDGWLQLSALSSSLKQWVQVPFVLR